MSRTVALTLVVVMVAVNFFSTTPAVPTLPHTSWSPGTWIVPWPVQIARAQAAGEGDYETDYIEVLSYEDLERLIIGAIVGYLIGWFADSLDTWTEWLLTP